MKSGDILVLKDECESAWKDGFPIKVRLTTQYNKGWHFEVLEYSDMDIQRGIQENAPPECDFLGLGTEELSEIYTNFGSA